MTTTIFQTKDYREFWTEDGLWKGTDNHRLFRGDEVSFEDGLPVLKKRTTAVKYIVGVLQTSSKMRYGIDRRGHQIYVFRPIDPTMPEFSVASKLNKQLKNHWAAIEFLDWDVKSQRPRGGIRELLGEVGDFKTECSALFKHYRRGFNWKARDPDVQSVIDFFQLSEWKDGREVWNHTVVSIDPEGCRDIDDAFSWDGSNLTIHITDLRPFIHPDTPLDKRAQEMNCTLYGFGENRPMLPSELSEGVLSLLPDGRDRAAISLVISEDGEAEFRQTIIRNKKALTYDNYRNFTGVEWDSLFKCVGLIATQMGFEAPTDSHKLVEIMMIYYNMKVAESLAKKKDGGIFRQHSDSKATVDNIPPELFHMYLEAATYSAEPGKHSMLGLEYYTHATSPIRRYADIIAQRLLIENTDSQSINIDELNTQTKWTKKYHRDYNYLYHIYNKTTEPLNGIVIDGKHIYISEWKQKVRIVNEFQIYSRVRLDYYVDPNPTQWKKRIIFEIL